MKGWVETNTEVGKRIEGVNRPKRLQMKGWVSKDTELGKGFKESIDSRDCR